MKNYKQSNRKDWRKMVYRGEKECFRQKNKDVGSAVGMHILMQIDEKKDGGW